MEPPRGGVVGVLRELWHAQLPHLYSPYTNAVLTIGRLLTAVQLLPNGLGKLGEFHQTALAIGGTPQFVHGRLFPDQHPLLVFPFPELFLGASVAFDLAGAVLLTVGWRTRLVAALVLAYVIFAMSVFHSDIRNTADIQQILRNLPFLAALLILSGTGAGAWSLDGRGQRARAH